jgi:hypothetical protein
LLNLFDKLGIHLHGRKYLPGQAHEPFDGGNTYKGPLGLGAHIDQHSGGIALQTLVGLGGRNIAFMHKTTCSLFRTI